MSYEAVALTLQRFCISGKKSNSTTIRINDTDDSQPARRSALLSRLVDARKYVSFPTIAKRPSEVFRAEREVIGNLDAQPCSGEWASVGSLPLPTRPRERSAPRCADVCPMAKLEERKNISWSFGHDPLRRQDGRRRALRSSQSCGRIQGIQGISAEFTVESS